MSILFKLILADARRHPARMALTSLAMIAAACMVIWVVSGYDTLIGQFGEFASKSFGRYELIVVPDQPRSQNPMAPARGPQRSVPPEMVKFLRTDPAIAVADPVMQARVTVRKLDPASRPSAQALAIPPVPLAPATAPSAGPAPIRPPGFGPPAPTLVGTDARQPPYPMLSGVWIDPDHPERPYTVISSKSAEQLQVQVGDKLVVRARGGDPYYLTVVGIVTQVAQAGDSQRMPMGPTRGPVSAAIYVPLALAEEILEDMTVAYIGVNLKSEVVPEQFRARIAPVLAQTKPALVLMSPQDLKNELKEGMSAETVRKQAWSATGISLLAALFIIFTTLSMGVSERIRQLAILRAVAFTRMQVATLIVGESLILAIIGWAGGLAAGWGLIWIMRQAKPDLFGPVSLGTWCILFSGICALGGALAASVIPAWRAARVSPLEGMSVQAASQRHRHLGWITGLGFFLTAVNPLLTFVAPVSEDARYAIYMAVGCSSMAIGFILLAPLAIFIGERAFGPVLAHLLGLQPCLLASQLTSNLWRTVGTTVALTIGLGLFVSIQVWGYSMLRPFVPGDWVPEAMVAFLPRGLPPDQIQAIQHAPGVRSGQCLPLAVEQPQLAGDITGSQSRASVTRQDNIVLIGVDPDRGLGGSSPLLDLQFVQGDREQAVRQLKQGRACVVPDHFLWETGLKVGDTFRLLPPRTPDKPVEYTIAGAVSLPGWHWMSKFSGVRMNSGRSAAMVFASYDNVQRDFSLDRVRFFWLNTNGSVTSGTLASHMRDIAQRSTGTKYEIASFGFSSMDTAPSVRITTAKEIRQRIGTRADGMIWAMSQLPLVTLAVTSLGVVSAVLASVRARRWDMGVLRAIGFGRSTLIRLVLAEALLIGLVACLLSLGFGVMAGWCGMGASQTASFFGGLHPGLVIPWGKLALGFGSTLGLCLLAALWPAIAVGRTEPLQLLQAGRAAT